MDKIKVLNLYAGIGGNRKLWENVDVTAIENNKEIAAIYKDFFPEDKVIVTDAHEYLLEHYKEFNFIWSSPPCPTHSGTNYFLNAQGIIRYPDMNLYQEILFLKHFFKGYWVVENVKSYYVPLIEPYECERHYLWSSFYISKKRKDLSITITNSRASTRRTKEEYLLKLQKHHRLDLSNYNIADTKKIKYLANCVRPGLALHIWNCAFKTRQTRL